MFTYNNIRFYTTSRRTRLAFFAGLFGAAGLASLAFSSAASYNLSQELESGTVAGCAAAVDTQSGSDNSGSGYVRFGTACPPPETEAPGAQLPITYNLAGLNGTIRYVAPTGNDTSGTGSQSSPFATLAKAVSVSSAGNTIVVRGGVYRDQGNVSIPSNKSLKIYAYPGEIPVFNGAKEVTGGWTTDGSLRYIAYSPKQATDGSGISFTTGQNLTADGVGKYPDQAWIGTEQLKEVASKSAVTGGNFWVDRAANRLYLSSVDAAKSGIEVSGTNVFLTVQAADSVVEGLRIVRYSNSASDYGVVKVQGGADRTVIRNVEIAETAFIAIHFDGTGNINDGSQLEQATITSSNWMGVVGNITDNLTLKAVKLHNMNQFNEFTFSPQSGGLKTSRTRHTKVVDSAVLDNNSHGLWFDQSNYDVVVANNTITGNKGSSVFFEISDKFLLINNYIRSTSSGQPVKLAGSSGLQLINNTIVGGFDPVGIYTDNRSIAGCADPAQPLCANSYSSDRDSVRSRQATLDWIPRLDLMLNNIIAYPTVTGYCGVLTALCLTQANASASVPLSTQIHGADSGRGIPQTYINGNVYANGTGAIFSYNTPQGRHTTVSNITSALAAAPVGISGLETNGKHGNAHVNADGSPTASLASMHDQAVAVPTDTVINAYIPAGTKHYGVTNK